MERPANSVYGAAGRGYQICTVPLGQPQLWRWQAVEISQSCVFHREELIVLYCDTDSCAVAVDTGEVLEKPIGRALPCVQLLYRTHAAR